MSIEQKLLEDMKLAMKSGKKAELDTIRILRAQIKMASIEKNDELTEVDVIQVLQKEAKKRRESIEMFKRGNREDLVKKEKSELDIISAYLPEQLSGDEVLKIIREVVSSLQVDSEKDMGRVMGVIMPKVKGKADGKLVQQKVKEYLSSLK